MNSPRFRRTFPMWKTSANTNSASRAADRRSRAEHGTVAAHRRIGSTPPKEHIMANRSTGRQNTGKNSSRGTSRGAQRKPSARGGASKNNKDFKGTGRPGASGRSQKP